MTIRRRRDEWIADGIVAELDQICLNAYDKMIGFDLADFAMGRVHRESSWRP